ncbi:restriction endonuclease fold toxin-2 domain-containing protein [Streptomyces pristinaespiralis]|uniref:restriction endonuclease fold toxin-2 domain-containing protein n=1 Tax=Streptomyces pristinaespiralis TaxID=38300 RepID=UPI0037BD964C
MSGLAPDLKFVAEGMIRGSMGLIESMRGARDTAIALGHELARQHGMAGDDDAGRAFAKVYVSAASATLNQMGFSSYVLGETSRGLMRTAREFMAQESKLVAQLLGKQVDLTVGMGDPGADCTENYLGLGRDLPEVVGETAWYDQYAPSGRSDRFRGSQEKIRDVAGSWRQAGSLMQRFLEDAQTYSSTAGKAHSGEAADAFRAYVKHFVGLTCPPAKAEADEPLVTNLVAACSQLAKACDRYADHVEAAKERIQQHQNDLFTVDMPWDQPMFGANGYDGGLHDAVLSDPWIQDLGNVAHALDSAAGRVRLPQPEGPTPPGLPGVPFLPPFIRVPVPVPVRLASFSGTSAPMLLPTVNPVDPGIPFADPIPPAPGSTRLLTASEQQQFRTWANTLRPGGLAGGGGPHNPDNAYQLRIAGYPEREVPLAGQRRGLMVDGIRPADGHLVEAKHVRDPDCTKKSFRSLDRVNETLAKPVKVNSQGKIAWDPLVDSMYTSDEQELMRYRQAMANPANREIRGLEIVTNGTDSAAYWQSMMAMTGTPGSTRYVP